MTVNPSDLLEAYRTDFSLFATKVFNILNPGQRFITTGGFLTMSHALAELQTGQIKRLLITVPPRSGKSMLASVALPAFVLGRDPTRRVLCASYSGELSAKFARDCRSVMIHPSYRQLFPATVIAGKNTEAEIETAHGGFRYATSVGGTLTGRGGNYIVVDDPIKPEDAMSRAARDRSWEWFTGTVGSRLDNKAEDAIIVVMQRLHVDDLAGHLLEQGGWYHLSLPAIAEIEEELPAGWGCTFSRKIGDVLDPQREPREILEQIKRDLSSATFNAQYQQSPIPLEGTMLKWSWFKFYHDPPQRMSSDRVVQSWDTASKSEEINDYSVGTTWLAKNNDYYLLDVFRARMQYPELKQRVRELANLHRANSILIEDKGSGTSLIQDLRYEGSLRPIAISPEKDKITRLHAQTAKIEAGQVFLPERAAWLRDFEAEMKQFPNGRYDDQVDSVSQFLNWVDNHRYRPARFVYIDYMGR